MRVSTERRESLWHHLPGPIILTNLLHWTLIRVSFRLPMAVMTPRTLSIQTHWLDLHMVRGESRVAIGSSFVKDQAMYPSSLGFSIYVAHDYGLSGRMASFQKKPLTFSRAVLGSRSWTNNASFCNRQNLVSFLSWANRGDIQGLMQGETSTEEILRPYPLLSLMETGHIRLLRQNNAATDEILHPSSSPPTKSCAFPPRHQPWSDSTAQAEAQQLMAWWPFCPANTSLRNTNILYKVSRKNYHACLYACIGGCPISAFSGNVHAPRESWGNWSY